MTEIEWRFQLGQTVTLKACLLPPGLDLPRILIVSRCYTESGESATARTYHGRIVTVSLSRPDVHPHLEIFHEDELAAWPAHQPPSPTDLLRGVALSREELLRTVQSMAASANTPAKEQP